MKIHDRASNLVLTGGKNIFLSRFFIIEILQIRRDKKIFGGMAGVTRQYKYKCETSN